MTSFWKTSSLVLLAPLLGIASAAVEPTVTLDTGVYHGVPTQRPGSSKVIHKYLGIPFAAPPVRFSPPKPLATSSTFKHATALPPACPQNGGGSFLSPEGTPESEDCLYLNLFAPAPTNATSSDGGKAVMVWFFGGALQFGTGSLPGYDGTSFATNQDIILIAPNYRTNVFGFPGEIPGVSEKERNLGFLDQRMALDWVQKNIKKFGGDPSKVTIFGESAGARSVDFHLLTTPNNPPFRGVIMQSGSSHITPGVQPKGTTTTKRAPMFISLAISVGCTDLEKVVECMRKLPFATVKNAVASGPFHFGASDDGLTVVRDAEAARRDHRVANVSLLIGTNADEQKATMRAQQRTPLAQYIGSTFGADAELKEKIAKGYPVGPNSLYKTEYDAMVAIATDMGFTCVTSRESKVSAEAGYRE
jgi:carboxylesterase type B